LRTRPFVRPVREVLGGHGRPYGAAERVGDLVRGDAEDERGERAAHISISRKRAQHSDAHLLRDVIGDVILPGYPAEPRTAVADDHRAHTPDERLDSRRVSLNGKARQVTEIAFVSPARTAQP